ncbi:unnamed protein product [Rotaria sp. Silwood2]|nr:unnamed protein product [Rotaria sp. Silwood2]CAF4617496.1 unnamed protein product [Rotaria sp. Silwood2]
MSAYSMFLKRLASELKDLTENPEVQSYFQYENSGNDEELKQFCIFGYLLPRTEPYKYGSYKVRIIVSSEFPFKTPSVQLLTYIYHPAVNDDVSKPYFCTACDCSEWMPSFRISRLIKYFVNVIDQPEANKTYCLMNAKAKELFDQNRAEYIEKALAMVQKYSCPRPNQSTISLKFAAKQMIRKELHFDLKKFSQLPEQGFLRNTFRVISHERNAEYVIATIEYYSLVQFLSKFKTFDETV